VGYLQGMRMLGGFLATALLAACSVHYPMRTSRFISPEAQGRAGAGTGSLSTSWAHDVEILADVGSSETDAEFDGRVGAVQLGGHFGVSDRWDLFFQSVAPFGAYYFGAKYQFLGEPRLYAERGNFSLAGTLAPGFAPIEVEAGADKFDGIVWIGDASLIAGYRLTDGLLLYGGPFYSYQTLNANRSPEADFSGHGHSFGANLGLRYEWKQVAVDVEGIWSEGRWDDDSDTQVGVAFGVHFFWGRK